MKIKKYMVFVAVASIILIIGSNSAVAANAIIWDTMVVESGVPAWEEMMDSESWANRASWRQVPYGTTGDYTFTGGAVFEDGNFYLFFPIGYKNSVQHAQPLLASKYSDGTIGGSPAFYGSNN